MSMQEFCAKEGITRTEDQKRAASFLEAHGQKFLVHYGYENVLAHAYALWRQLGAH